MTDAKDMAGDGREHAEDLSALARRQALSEPEERRLRLCLASSDALRALHDIGCDFDELDTARPEDTELLARIAARARKRARAPGRAGSVRTRGLAVWIGSAIVLGGTLAAAATMLYIAGAPSPEQPSYGVRSTERATQHKDRGTNVRPRVGGPAAPGAEGSAEPVPAPQNAEKASSKPVSSLRLERPAPSAAGQRPSVAHDASSAESKLEEPARLFSVANAARRRGELDKSLGTYQQLQAQFPGSAEAVLSHVMVGRLQLRRGNSTLALAEFGRYLRAEPRGALAQEALEGKAHALRQLGRVTEERAAYQELLSRYPNSIYARTARERLGGSD